MEQNPDKYLVSEVLSGNKEAFIKLIRQYEGLVLHIVTPLVGITEDREDICQDIFIKVYEKLDTFRFQAKLGTWIGNIAYNTAVNFLKKSKRFSFGEYEDEFHGEIADDDQSPLLIREEDIGLLNNAIEQLGELQRTVIVLFYKEELSLEDINIVMEIPINTIKSHLFRARQALKKIIQQTRDNEGL